MRVRQDGCSAKWPQINRYTVKHEFPALSLSYFDRFLYVAELKPRVFALAHRAIVDHHSRAALGLFSSTLRRGQQGPKWMYRRMTLQPKWTPCRKDITGIGTAACAKLFESSWRAPSWF